MKALTRSVFVSVLVALVLAVPAGLSAKGRRGANIVVTKLDGALVSGELIAVKPDTLLLLGEGTDISVPFADIRSVRIVKKSHAGLFTLVGSVPGAVTGVMLGSDPEIKSGELVWGTMIGGLGALAGLGLSQILGVDTKFAVAGEPEDVVSDRWDRLRRYSREGRLAGAPRPVDRGAKPARRTVVPGPAAPPPKPPAPSHEPRFGLRLSAWAHSSGLAELPSASGSFRFPDSPSPEQGPYPLSFIRWHKTGALIMGPSLGLVYEWKDRLCAELELFDLGSSISGASGDLRYTSSTDGKTYVFTLWANYRARFTGLLFGLTYRSAVPRAFHRHVVEFGAAAGPALVRGLRSWDEIHFPGGGIPNPIGRKLILSGRLQAAYDYYLYPSVSIGAVAGARIMAANASGSRATGLAPFFEEGAPGVAGTARLTEITFPTLPVKASGFYWGLRVGFRL